MRVDIDKGDPGLHLYTEDQLKTGEKKMRTVIIITKNRKQRKQISQRYTRKFITKITKENNAHEIGELEGGEDRAA